MSNSREEDFLEEKVRSMTARNRKFTEAAEKGDLATMAQVFLLEQAEHANTITDTVYDTDLKVVFAEWSLTLNSSLKDIAERIMEGSRYFQAP